MKTIATLTNGIWICNLIEMNGAETMLFHASSIPEVYTKLDELGLFPYYPHEFREVITI